MARRCWSNVTGAVRRLPQNMRAYFELIEEFQPEVVISDFESWTYLYAKTHRLPILSHRQHADHQPLHARAGDPRGARGRVPAHQGVRQGQAPVLRPLLHHHVLLPAGPQAATPRCFPPILRPEILAAKRRGGRAPARLPDRRGQHGARRRRWQEPASSAASTACGASIKEEQVEGNLRYRPFSEDSFIDDLRTARGVIAGGGFTLMGEAVYLHKPMLAVPLAQQFEQVLNARYLELEGFGLGADEITAARLGEFVERLPDFERKLAGYTQDGNKDLLGALETGLEAAAASR